MKLKPQKARTIMELFVVIKFSSFVGNPLLECFNVVCTFHRFMDTVVYFYIRVVVMSFLIIVSLLVLLNLMLVGLGFKPLRAYLCWGKINGVNKSRVRSWEPFSPPLEFTCSHFLADWDYICIFFLNSKL